MGKIEILIDNERPDLLEMSLSKYIEFFLKLYNSLYIQSKISKIMK